MSIISTDRAIARLALAAILATACSKSATHNEGGGAGTGGGAGGAGGAAGTPTMKGTCDNDSIEILFSPMYSAYDGVNRFKVPAVVDGINPTALSWSASDPSMVDLQPDPATGGVMITVQKAGKVDIIAHAGGLCGKSVLTITQATADDYKVGSARYTDGIVLRGLPPRGTGGPDAGNAREAACTNCHGDTATAGPFRTVAHSPQQTGGFSDQELIDIFTKGIVPANGYFDETIVDYDFWQTFHKWEMSPEQAKGMVVYLRSLTPVAQKGMRGDFGGRRGDGGRPDGGFRRGDGGGRRGDGGGDQPGADASTD